MNILDIILLILLGLAVIDGWRKGILVQIGGIAGIVLGIWLAFRYSGPLAAWAGYASAVADWVAFGVIVLAAILAGALVGWCVGKVVGAAGLGMLNRLGGAVLSLLKGVLILGALLIFCMAIDRTTGLLGPRTFADSRLCAPIVRTTRAVLPFLGRALGTIEPGRDADKS